MGKMDIPVERQLEDLETRIVKLESRDSEQPSASQKQSPAQSD